MEKKGGLKLILFLILIVILAIIIFIFYQYFTSPYKKIGLGAEIENFTISQDGKTAYVKLRGGSFVNITKIKFIFKGKDGKEYFYETTEGIKEIEVPFKRSFWQWFFGHPKYKGKFDYTISSEDAGLENFNDIENVSVSFEYVESGKQIDTGTIDTGKPTNQTQPPAGGGGGGNGGDGDDEPPQTCTSKTCDELRKDCGIWDDGCGNELDCGTCYEGVNLVKNPGFESDFGNWSPNSACYLGDISHPECDDGTEEIVEEGCYSGKCLKMIHNNSTWQGTSQNVGRLMPGKTYLFSVKFKTASSHYGYINLHNPSWKNSSCGKSSVSNTRNTPGNGDWKTLKFFVTIPEHDECGETTTDDNWWVYLYSYTPYEDNNPIYYDEVSLILIDDFSYSNLEEKAELKTTECRNISSQYQYFNENHPVVTCYNNFFIKNAEKKISGDSSLVLTGTRDRMGVYSMDIPVKSDTTYKISFSLKIEDRVVYNYLNLDYPTYLTQQRDGLKDDIEYTKGIWSGRYYFKVDNTNILQEIIKDAEYRSPSDLDWFREENYFKTDKKQMKTSIAIRLQGFEGRLYIDNLTLEEVDSFVEDKYFHMPIETEFQGMKIKSVSTSIGESIVETNAAKFSFYTNWIEMKKQGEIISRIIFPVGFLANLNVIEETGNVFIENGNVQFSVGADSTIIAKLKKDTNISVTGNKPEYHNFEAGIIFATDYSKGILFSPLRTKIEVLAMPYNYNISNGLFSYNDSTFESSGIKFWNTASDFDKAYWQVDYNFEVGEGFVVEVFPPKEFDASKYCKERRSYLSAEYAEANTLKYPQADFSYLAQKLEELSNIGLIWMNDYAVSENLLNPPEYFCTNATGSYIYCDETTSDSGITKTNVSFKLDVTGPYTAGEPAAFKKLVEKAHENGVKVIIYMSPHYYYTSNVDVFLENLREFIDEYDINGVYYDGLYPGDALKSLEIARKTRNLLGDKFYEQHASWNTYLIKRAHNFRVPFLDAYADRLTTGEVLKAVDNNTWLLNYCGRNVSNTISMLLGELRPVDWDKTDEENIAMTLTPEKQIEKTLECQGIFGSFQNPREKGVIRDGKMQIWIDYDTNLFLEPYNQYCLAITCGDNICDIGEDINNCPKDCAPKTSDATLSKSGNTYTCNTNYDVTQWFIDDKPLYKLHFTFDNETAEEESENKINPASTIGISYAKPEYKEIDAEKTFYFDGSATLFGNHYGILNLTEKNFSAFARIKRNDNGDDWQIVFNLNYNDGKTFFYYGIGNSNLRVAFRNMSENWTNLKGTNEINDMNWHTIGVVYENPKLKVYFDGNKENETDLTGSYLYEFSGSGKYYIGASSASGSNNFIGYIDDIFVTDFALTDEQVLQYNNTKHKNLTVTNAVDVECIIKKDGKKYTAIIGSPGIPIPPASSEVKSLNPFTKIWNFLKSLLTTKTGRVITGNAINRRVTNNSI